MSSLRNAVQRRNHKERAQPLERQKLGLLEKHKDYSLRAKDWNKKKATLKSLRQKAADRNEDEFYFGMLSRKGPGSALTRGKRSFTGTVEGDRGNKALDVDTVRLLKTQDIGYLRTIRNVAAKEVVELEQRAVIAGAMRGEVDDDEDEDEDEPAPRKKAKKIVFMDNAEDQSQVVPVPEKEEEDDDDMDLDDESGDGRTTEADANAIRAERLRRRLQNARKKLKALTRAENELELQRAKMAKTATIGGVTKNGKKIKIRERKR